MNGLCLVAGLMSVALGPQATVSWQHSVEKIPWEEDYRATPHGVELTEARVYGTGAGMDIPADALLRDGSWHYRPKRSHLLEVRLTHSPFTAPYTICAKGLCQPLPQWLPGLARIEVVILKPCPSR